MLESQRDYAPGRTLTLQIGGETVMGESSRQPTTLKRRSEHQRNYHLRTRV